MLKQVIAADSGDVIGEEKMEEAERNGLESERVQCTVSDTTMKATMMAVAMGSADSGLGISKKKLSKKSEKRFQAETSVMGETHMLRWFYQRISLKDLALMRSINSSPVLKCWSEPSEEAH